MACLTLRQSLGSGAGGGNGQPLLLEQLAPLLLPVQWSVGTKAGEVQLSNIGADAASFS